MKPSWVIRDDKPDPECNCGMLLLGGDHSRWCEVVRAPGGTFYYVGQDLEGHWFMPGIEQAARYSYRVAQGIRRELNAKFPRKVELERAPEAIAA